VAGDAHILERITVDPGLVCLCGGRPCIRGLRIRVGDILEMLAIGVLRAKLLADFPDLEADDIAACLKYAAKRVDVPHVAA
jgi:uncharacterized protein (DUF433 family)